MPYPQPEPLSLWKTTADLYLHRRCSNTVLSQSLWGPWILVRTRFVEPSECLWQEQSLILNVNSSLLQSCWGFSFPLGLGVSPHSHFSAYHLTGVFLTLNVGVSPLGCLPLQRCTATTLHMYIYGFPGVSVVKNLSAK